MRHPTRRHRHVRTIEPLEPRTLLSTLTFTGGDFNRGTSSPLPVADLTDNNGALLYMNDDGTHGVELCRSDGSPAGTALLKDISPGPDDSPPPPPTPPNPLPFTP